jgi:hypothetical protein
MALGMMRAEYSLTGGSEIFKRVGGVRLSSLLCFGGVLESHIKKSPEVKSGVARERRGAISATYVPKHGIWQMWGACIS